MSDSTGTLVSANSMPPSASPSPRSGPTLALPRRVSATLVALGAWLSPLAGLGGLGTAVALLLLATLIALAQAPPVHRSARRLGVLETLPISFAYAMLSVTVLGLLATWTGTDLWSQRIPATATWTAVLAIPTAVAFVRAGHVRLASRRTSVALFAASQAFFWAPAMLLPFEQWVRSATIGTDFPRHVVIMQQVGEQGGLEYASSIYPRSAHATIALVQGASGDVDYASAWQATHATMLVMLALLAFATAVFASRAASAMALPGWLASYFAPIAALVLSFTGVWVGAVLPGGYLTTVQAGLIIAAAAMLLWDGDRIGAPRIVIGLLALTALLAHSWLILAPVVAVPAAWLTLKSVRLRKHHGLLLAGVILAAATATPVALASIADVGISGVGIAGSTTVPQPGIRWLLMLVLAAYGAVLLSRKGAAGPGTAAMLMLLALLGVELLLLTVRQTVGGDWYYVTKTAWTPLALLMGLAIPAALLLAQRIVLRLRRPHGKPPTRSGGAGFIGALGLVMLALLHWPASPVRSVEILWGHETKPALALPLMGQFPDSPTAAQHSDFVVWGLTPELEATDQSIRRATWLDQSSLSTFVFAGYPMADFQALYPALVSHDPVAFCDYLRDHPTTGRITGPLPEQSIGWLQDAGCPDEVVRPDEWLSVDIGPEWFAEIGGEPVELGTNYPSWEQARPIVEELREASAS